MAANWNSLGFKDKAQYVTAMLLIASGVLIAFLSFFMLHNISNGVLIYIALAFVAGGSIFGVSIYFKNLLIEAHSLTMTKLRELIEDVVLQLMNNNE